VNSPQPNNFQNQQVQRPLRQIRLFSHKQYLDLLHK
jgi:hypothetical protein